MKIENTEVYGFRPAFRGMRNPMDSWEDSDSEFLVGARVQPPLWDESQTCLEQPLLGAKDLALAVKLVKQGGDHRKFLRMICVWCDFVLPRYVWQEVDTYKVGTVRNSCSTMNTLGKRQLVQGDFEGGLPEVFLDELNLAVSEFQSAETALEKKGLRVELKGLLPEGFLQRATYLLNYEVGLRMFFSRRNHRLPMWKEGVPGSICEWIRSWPYMKQFLDAAL